MILNIGEISICSGGAFALNGHYEVMQSLISQLASLLLTISRDGVWIPSMAMINIVLIMGAFLAAGVAMSAFSFYEDFYWGDKEYRDQLRVQPFNRGRRSSKSRL